MDLVRDSRRFEASLKEEVLQLLAGADGVQKLQGQNPASAEQVLIRMVKSPYRVCPLGAHIDHQGGPVTAMALDFGINLAFAPSNSSEVRLLSRQFRGVARFRLDRPFVRGVCAAEHKNMAEDGEAGHKGDEGHEEEEGAWGDYARGAAWALVEAGHSLRQGIVGVISGEDGVQCCGISSSAAVGVAYLLALARANDIALSQSQLIQLDRQIENGFLGLKNGVLDQSAIVLSKRSSLTLIRCNDGTHEVIPFHAAAAASTECKGQPRKQQEQHKQQQHEQQQHKQQQHKQQEQQQQAQDGDETSQRELPLRTLLAFSGVRGALTASSGYNRRVDECWEAAQLLLRRQSELAGCNDPKASGEQPQWQQPLLCHVPREVFESFENDLPTPLAKRARHFFSECERVEKGVSAWKDGDMATFGRLMSESGQSSIDNYECGIEPLITLHAILLRTPGVLGARFSGAGFRGCCVALVERAAAAAVAEAVAREYGAAHPELCLLPQPGCAPMGIVVVCDSGDGARLI